MRGSSFHRLHFVSPLFNLATNLKNLLFAAATKRPNETWTEWAARLRPAIRYAATIVNRPLDDATINRRLQSHAGMGQVRNNPEPARPVAWHDGTRFDTIHGVKGEGFDIVALYCPQPATPNHDGSTPRVERQEAARILPHVLRPLRDRVAPLTAQDERKRSNHDQNHAARRSTD